MSTGRGWLSTQEASGRRRPEAVGVTPASAARGRVEAGKITVEWVALAAVVVVVLAAVAATGVADRVGDAVATIVCQAAGVATDADCPFGGDDLADAGVGEEPADEAEDADGGWNLDADGRYAEAADRYGGRVAELYERLVVARGVGDQQEAAAVAAGLDRALGAVESGERGELFQKLYTASDEDFAELVARDSHHTEEGHAVRYFQTEATGDGEGTLVFDFFIHQEDSWFLAGDDRDFPDSGHPFDDALAVDDSRMMLVVDQDTGRGKVVTTITCSVDGSCTDARDIHLDGESRWQGFGSRANHFTVDASDDRMAVQFTGLNSRTPLGVAVDGEVELHRGDDGWSVAGGQRDGYPSLGLYHVDGEEAEVISQQCGGGFHRAFPPGGMDVEEVSEGCH